MTEYGYMEVRTTVGSEHDARQMAEMIVAARLAACVQSAPVKSTYRWEGKVEDADEHVVSAKTTARLADSLMAFVRDHHSYELPEIIATPLIGGTAEYLEWIETETEQQTDER